MMKVNLEVIDEVIYTRKADSLGILHYKNYYHDGKTSYFPYRRCGKTNQITGGHMRDENTARKIVESAVFASNSNRSFWDKVLNRPKWKYDPGLRKLNRSKGKYDPGLKKED